MTRELRAKAEVLSLPRHVPATLNSLSKEVRAGLVNQAAITVAKAGTDRLADSPVLGTDGGLSTLCGKARA